LSDVGRINTVAFKYLLVMLVNIRVLTLRITNDIAV